MKPLPFLGGGTRGKSTQTTAQRILNVYLEARPDGDKGTKVVAYGTPGMLEQFEISPTLPAPIRGLMGTPASLYAISGSTFYQLTAGGAQDFAGTLNSTSGYASLSYSPTQVLVADGVNGYLFNGSALSVIGASFPNGARTLTYVSTFFVAEQPGTQNFWVSNEEDGSTWGGTAFAAASAYSDNILAVDNLAGNLIIFSLRHMEFWQDVGSTPQPFAPIVSAANGWGLAALFSRVHLNNAAGAECIFFLGLSKGGQVQVCMLSGYQVSVVSTPDIDSIINGDSDVPGFTVTSDAVALSYQVGAHSFYQITFPTADRSFLLDTSTGKWSEVQSGLTTKYATRHKANLSTLFGGQTPVSDATSSVLYTMSPSTYTDAGSTIEREIVTRHAIESGDEFCVDELFLDFELGQGPSKLSGQNQPQVMLQISRDSGHTWEDEQWCPMGYQGEYGRDGNRVAWQRLGSGRVFTAKIRMTDPYKFALTYGALSVRQMRPQSGISQAGR